MVEVKQQVSGRKLISAPMQAIVIRKETEVGAKEAKPALTRFLHVFMSSEGDDVSSVNCFKFLGQRFECYHNTSWFDSYFMNCLISSDIRFCFEFSF